MVCKCGHAEADHRIGRSSLGHCRAFGCACEGFEAENEAVFPGPRARGAAVSLPTLTEYRQSTLRALEVCPRRTRFALEAGELATGWTGGSTRLGALFHAFVFSYMETLKSPEFRPARNMPTEEAVNIAREVYANSTATLDTDSYASLIGMAVRFCEFEWNVDRILFQEDPLRVELLCPDGEIRTLKGQPDLVYSDPPRGVIIYDWKTGLGQPRSPRKVEDDGETVEGKQYLSDVGKYQRLVYGLLVLRALPAAQYAILREIPMRFAKYGPRQARLGRDELEHVEPKLAADMARLDRGVREGSGSEVWEPIPGSQCQHCEAARSCPIPPGLRGVGAVESQVDADIEARRFVRGKAMYVQAAERLKARQEAGLSPGRVNGREEARWGPEADAWQRKGGGRKWGVWPIETMANGGSDGE